MGWLTDPRKWDDGWFRQLSCPAQHVWDVCMTSRLRTNLPGLLANACESTIAFTGGKSIDLVREGLRELLLPDSGGKCHVLFDPAARVIRIPQAPKYQKAANPGQLTSWFKMWRDVPDCGLKWDHLQSIPMGVNLENEYMARCWKKTFGKVVAELSNGKKLSTYAELVPEYENYETVSKRSKQVSKPSENPASGSEIGSDQRSEIGSEIGSVGLKTVSRPSPNSSDLIPFQSNQKAVTNGPVAEGNGGPGGGAPARTPVRKEHPANATPERRRELEVAGWHLSKAGNWLPPGFE